MVLINGSWLFVPSWPAVGRFSSFIFGQLFVIFEIFCWPWFSCYALFFGPNVYSAIWYIWVALFFWMGNFLVEELFKSKRLKRQMSIRYHFKMTTFWRLASLPWILAWRSERIKLYHYHIQQDSSLLPLRHHYRKTSVFHYTTKPPVKITIPYL